MQPERLQRWWKAVLVLYLISFALPVGTATGLGILVFLLSLLMSPVIPILFLVWLANPLFWVGLASLRGGRWNLAAALGGASVFAAIPSLLFIRWSLILDRPHLLPYFLLTLCGYFAWLASITLLALISSLIWLSRSSFKDRPQVRLSWLMMAIAAIAVAFAILPPPSEVWRWILGLTDGFLGIPNYLVGPE